MLMVRASWSQICIISNINVVENAHDLSNTFFSKVRFGSNLPIITFEEIEHHLEDVQCGSSHITVELRSREAQEALRGACDNEDGAYIITSHDGCNPDGERTAYQVKHHASSEKGLSFKATKIPFHKAFTNMKLEFGQSKEGHVFRDGQSLRRRQAPEAPFPLPENNGSPGITIDLNSVVKDTVLPLPTNITDLLPVGIPVEIRCVECSTSGSLELSAGEFEMDLNVFDGDGIDLFQSGFISMIGNGIGARLEMAATPSAEFTTELPLPSIPIPALGFSIPGIGNAGVNFSPEISLSFGVKGGIEFTYGLTASIPDKSEIRINFADFGSSSTTGFTNPTVEALPFNANVSAVEMTLATGFRPRLTLGFEFVGSATAEVGIFADLPSLSATFSTQSKVDQNCNPLPADAAPADAADPLASALGDFTLVDFSIGVVLGLSAQLAAPVIPDFATELPLASTTFQLATSCMAAVPSGTGLAPAAPLVSSMVQAGQVASWVAALPDVPPATPLAPAFTPPAVQPHALGALEEMVGKPDPVGTANAPYVPANTSGAKPGHVYQVVPAPPAIAEAAVATEAPKVRSRFMRALV
ncbi:hypothetical protein EJ05DRAFT_172005 [Pseudovirgaria hyperparasitica]|uniref:Uncharacterized protein n=1 Tax=Pseudovirgaria hyperparasitica TaxID=470096 RepID=A0A6A6VSZ8_9PEZI|nr:uncharacterized protein EJ05DRAFT_172005 [Pseudovirgaria hyperparasitica]KAF2753798.1 hypothetical protein EJ05DRAFT_172005 [Pseudovirgaria hyperparasitica]